MNFNEGPVTMSLPDKQAYEEMLEVKVVNSDCWQAAYEVLVLKKQIG